MTPRTLYTILAIAVALAVAIPLTVRGLNRLVQPQPFGPVDSQSPNGESAQPGSYPIK